MKQVLAEAGAAPDVVNTATGVANGDIRPDSEIDALVDVLAAAMLGDYNDDEGLGERGLQIDDFIGIVQQMSESFYR